MPFGYLITVLIFGVCVLLLLRPVSRVPLFQRISFWGGLLVNEQAHWYAIFLAGITVLTVSDRAPDSPAVMIPLALMVVVLAGLLVLFIRGFSSRPALRQAIGELDPGAVNRLAGPRSHLLTVVAPIAFGGIRAKRTGNIRFGPAGKFNRLDLYRPRNGEVTGPTLIYFHGGRFRSGDKRREAQAIHYRLASRGWAVISANYRLAPKARFPDYIVDLKRAVAWARSEGPAYGIDPDRIFLAGGSSGAHIAVTGAMTANRPELQPGFEEADTSVSGTVGLYGYYGGLDLSQHKAKPSIPSDPKANARPGLPPFLLIHGSHDSLVSPQHSRTLAERLRANGNHVAMAELPGAEHTFDLLRSVRTDNTIDAIEDFVAWVESSRTPSRREGV